MPNLCSKCDGEGWLWAHELDEYHGENPRSDDTKYSCDGEWHEGYRAATKEYEGTDILVEKRINDSLRRRMVHICKLVKNLQSVVQEVE